MVNQLASVHVEGRAPGEKGTSRKLPQGSGEVWKSRNPTRNPQVDTDTRHPPTRSPTHPQIQGGQRLIRRPLPDLTLFDFTM
ncbi:hypothetical protein M9X92_001192 [Pyricularia oryzae]|nr:hypothetical protein M9X92_001192 [Pyricularia oryzae]